MKSALRILLLSTFRFSSINYSLVCSLTLYGIFSAISVQLTTKNSDDLEIWVPDGPKSLKVTPVNSSCVIFCESLIVPKAVSWTIYEI